MPLTKFHDDRKTYEVQVLNCLLVIAYLPKTQRMRNIDSEDKCSFSAAPTAGKSSLSLQPSVVLASKSLMDKK